MKSYDATPLPYYSKMGIGAANMAGLSRDDKLMEKINYMIHLLENQQNEKPIILQKNLYYIRF